jgi:uncharacterized protein (TIGR04255 family)
MSDPVLSLKAPPIVEAVVDIECDFKPSHDLKAFEDHARGQFRSIYPKYRPQFLQEFQFQWKENQTIGRSERLGLQALQFLTDDEKQLVQVRTTGYSFNRLAPYTSFDDYLPEVQRTWNLYRGIVCPIQVKSIRLRYINRMRLPFTESQVSLDEYIQLGASLPEEARLDFVGFLTQYVAVDRESGHQVTAVLTTERQDNDAVPVIFDNSVAATISVEPDSWSELEDVLRTLRALKNRVFRNTLTAKCLNLFQ